MATNLKGVAPNVPEGFIEGCCVGVWDLGYQDGAPKFPGFRPKILLQFECAGHTKEKPMLVNQEYTAILSAKSNIQKDLQSWRGRPFTAEELQGFSLKKVMGVPARLLIVHENGWAKIGKIGPAQAPYKPTSEFIFYDIEDAEIPAGTPEWIKNKIMKSQEKSGGAQAQSGEQSQAPAHPQGEVPF